MHMYPKDANHEHRPMFQSRPSPLWTALVIDAHFIEKVCAF